MDIHHQSNIEKHWDKLSKVRGRLRRTKKSKNYTITAATYDVPYIDACYHERFDIINNRHRGITVFLTAIHTNTKRIIL